MPVPLNKGTTVDEKRYEEQEYDASSESESDSDSEEAQIANEGLVVKEGPNKASEGNEAKKEETPKALEESEDSDADSSSSSESESEEEQFDKLHLLSLNKHLISGSESESDTSSETEKEQTNSQKTANEPSNNAEGTNSNGNANPPRCRLFGTLLSDGESESEESEVTQEHVIENVEEAPAEEGNRMEEEPPVEEGVQEAPKPQEGREDFDSDISSDSENDIEDKEEVPRREMLNQKQQVSEMEDKSVNSEIEDKEENKGNISKGIQEVDYSASKEIIERTQCENFALILRGVTSKLTFQE